MSAKIITPEGYAPPLPAAEKKALLEKSPLGREISLKSAKKTPSISRGNILRRNS